MSPPLNDGDELDLTLRALADGNRRAILALISESPHAVGHIAAHTNLSQQAASHHLRILRVAGLVSEVREGTRHLFAVRSEGLTAASDYLNSFWPDQLASLKRAVETAVRGSRDG